MKDKESEPTLYTHFGVYAVIINERNEILLIKKARGPYTGKYDLPGGSMEAEELIEETLHREIAEETGCKIETFRELGSASTLYNYDKNKTLRHFGLLFDVKISGEPKHGPDGEDSAGCEWIKIDKLPHNGVTPFVITALNRLSS